MAANQGTRLPCRSCLAHVVVSIGFACAISATSWLGLVILNSSQAAEGAGSDRSTAAGIDFFEKSIRPLLVQHCYECHAAGKANGGFNLDSRLGVLKGGDSGPAVSVGDPEKSLLIEAVRYKNSDLQMPPKKKLSAAEIEALEKWVKLGVPDPRVSSESHSAPAPVGMSIEEGRQFWSFRPLANSSLPHVNNKIRVQSPVDAFLFASQESAGIQSAHAADRRVLIRRVTWDLTGLPPTPTEIDNFLEDTGPDAFAKVVDRLLSSPRYGVRWGRHWLDVARYADSNGLDENLAFGNAWRYRDYVVNAFNADLSFQQFIIEQLAGDLLPYADTSHKTATGFLVLGAKVLAEPDREKLEMDTIDEQLDTLGKAFLGMTLGCVRCHDHKFDPIKQTDYYGLAAIFKSTQTFGDTKRGAIKHWHEYPIASPEDTERLKKFDAEIAEKKKAAATFKSEALARVKHEARTKAAYYLAAAASFEPSMPLTRIAAIAETHGLHPHILHHCRLHLEYRRDDPVFAKWHELAAVGDASGILAYYAALFEETDAALIEAREGNPKATSIPDRRLEAVRAALVAPNGFLAIPSKPDFALDAATYAEYHRLADEARIAESFAPDAPSIMGVSDAKLVSQIPIHIRGNHRKLGALVSRGFPTVMGGTEVDLQTEFSLPTNQSGRLELARWIASAKHPLTARVYVNRIWRWHFGRGLVSSTENFGKLGDRPTHPELLDWLARYFMDAEWSTKQLHRLILTSSAYQMASSHPQESTAAAIDPENRLLWKFRIQRLEAEQIRDGLLAVAGRLDETMSGKTVPLRNRQFVFDHTSIDHTKYDSLRRSIYLPLIRNNVYTLFEQFDFPDPTMPTGDRNATVVAPQALLMMNFDLVLDSATAFAARVLNANQEDSQRLRHAYELAFGRTPSPAEVQRGNSFIRGLLLAKRAMRETQRTPTPDLAAQQLELLQAWSVFCQSLLASNEFIYVR